MNWSVFRLLYVHEIRMLVRARRTIVLAVLLPALIMPLMLLTSKYSNDQRAQTLADTTYKFAIVGPLSVRIRGLIERTKELTRPRRGNSSSLKSSRTTRKDPWKPETFSSTSALRPEKKQTGWPPLQRNGSAASH